MYYQLLYLPVDKAPTDGCNIIDQSGDLHTYNANDISLWSQCNCRVAEPFLVKTEYNETVIVGRPSPRALRWMKNKDQVKIVDCQTWIYDDIAGQFVEPLLPDTSIPANNGLSIYIRIRCPHCGDMH